MVLARGSLALAGAAVLSVGANAQLGGIGDAIRDTGNAVDRAGRDVGRAVERTERQTDRAIRRTERQFNDRYDDARGPIRDAVGDTVRGAGRIAGEATRAVTGRPRLGVTFDEARDSGLYISDVDSGSVAYRAGIRSGDQIVTINGRRFESYHDAVPYIRDYDDDNMDIVVLRDGRHINLAADLAARADVRVGGRTVFRGDRPTLGVWFDTNAGNLTISRVTDGSPAYRAGIRRGDRILALDGRRVSEYRDVTRYLADLQPDEDVDILVLRNGRELHLDATLTAAAETRRDVRRYEPREYRGSDRASLGVVFDDSDRDSLVITRVESGSPAFRAGLRRGDRIYALNGRRINSYRDLNDYLADLDADADISIGVVRDDRRMTVDATLASRSNVFDDRDADRGDERRRDRYDDRFDDRTDRVADRYDERRDRADDRFDERTDRVTDRMDDRRDRLEDRAEDTRDDIRRRADRTRDRLEDTREARRERTERTRDRIEDRADDARDSFDDARSRARENIRENFREGFDEGRDESNADDRDSDGARQPPEEPKDESASDRSSDRDGDESAEDQSKDSDEDKSADQSSDKSNEDSNDDE
jgi:S1-C subfamily serine protease